MCDVGEVTGVYLCAFVGAYWSGVEHGPAVDPAHRICIAKCRGDTDVLCACVEVRKPKTRSFKGSRCGGHDKQTFCCGKYSDSAVCTLKGVCSPKKVSTFLIVVELKR